MNLLGVHGAERSDSLLIVWLGSHFSDPVLVGWGGLRAAWGFSTRFNRCSSLSGRAWRPWPQRGSRTAGPTRRDGECGHALTPLRTLKEL